MTRLALLLPLAVALTGGCSKSPAFAPDMTCEALEAELEKPERKVRTLEGDAVGLEGRDLMGVLPRSGSRKTAGSTLPDRPDSRYYSCPRTGYTSPRVDKNAKTT